MINTTIVTGPMITIDGAMRRHEIVKTVVNQFIETEHSQKGAGIKFQYPVETLSGATTLMIGRPGLKKNFDFKVIVQMTYGLGAGKHGDVAHDVTGKAQENPREFEELWRVVSDVYHCRENNVDVLLAGNPSLPHNFRGGTDVSTLLKVLKWFFVMEDIVYWDNEGRAFLYNWLNYQARETDMARFQKASNAVKAKPLSLKRYLKLIGLEWIPSEG